MGLVLKGASFMACRAPEHRSKTNVNAPPDFPAYAALADALIDRATKDQLADVARLLALNIAWYQERYGDVP